MDELDEEDGDEYREDQFEETIPDSIKGKYQLLRDLGLIEFKERFKTYYTEDWNIIHDIGVFYMYFANLADHPDGDLKDEELNYIGDAYPKWDFTIDGVKYGFEHDNPSDLQETWDHIFSKIYDSGDPMPRVNESHKNLVDY